MELLGTDAAGLFIRPNDLSVTQQTTSKERTKGNMLLTQKPENTNDA